MPSVPDQGSPMAAAMMMMMMMVHRYVLGCLVCVVWSLLGCCQQAAICYCFGCQKPMRPSGRAGCRAIQTCAGGVCFRGGPAGDKLLEAMSSQVYKGSVGWVLLIQLSELVPCWETTTPRLPVHS